MGFKTFLQKHSLLAYFVLVFVLSWGGVLLVVGPGGLPMSIAQLNALGPLAYVTMLIGPAVAGILMTGIVSGRAGLRDLRSRLLRWRVNVRWYLVALLTAPVLTLAILLVLSLFSPEFMPRVLTPDSGTALLLTGILVGLMVGFFEELGWTGFAVPTLLRRGCGIFMTGLFVGVIWGAWHFILFWEPGSFTDSLLFALLLARLFAWLPAYRVLMVWLYARSGSLLVVILMHAALVCTQLVLMPVALGGVSLLAYLVLWAAALWVLAAAVSIANQRHVSRPQPRPQLA